MLTQAQILSEQIAQHAHDTKFHFDVAGLSRIDRLKHYGLHFAKYAGRMARGSSDLIPYQQTLADIFLISLSSANALEIKLTALDNVVPAVRRESNSFLSFVSLAGKYCDACEKIDHLEDFRDLLIERSQDIFAWLTSECASKNVNILDLACQRRLVLKNRHFYVK